MQTQHTPGPWAYKGKETAGAGGLLLGRDGEPIAVVYGEKTNPRAEHDGNIMEAAPDLLAALIELRDWYTERTGLPAVSANSAIAKAMPHNDGGKRSDD